MAQLKNLKRFAVAGFIGTVSSYFAFQYTVSTALIKSKLCNEAMELVRNHTGAIQFLGEPIEPVSASFYDYGKNPFTATIKMIVSGPKSTGEVFLNIKENDESQREIVSVQLQIGSEGTRRLEIKSSGDGDS